MPIFEYTCHRCDESFEELEWSWEKHAETECPHCGASDTERLVSTFSTSGSEELGSRRCSESSPFG